MNNPRLAGRYAKSLMGLAVENNQTDTIYGDMQYLRAICKSSKEFTTLLVSPVITSDKKQAIIDSVAGSKISPLTNLFIKLLVKKNREGNLPEITEAFINQYYAMNGIHKMTLTTAKPVGEEVKQAMVDKVKAIKNIKQIDLTAVVDEKLIGGFTLKLGDAFVDASILHDLIKIQRQFENNDYIHQIR